MRNTLAERCGGSAFIFVPNVCNAACAFCYVSPAESASATASAQVINRANVAATALASLGFSSVRFTGGEPTLFSNLDAMIMPFLQLGLRYRILSNGIHIEKALKFLAKNPPERFTLSVHSTRQPSKTFGIPLSSTNLALNRARLLAIAEVEATVVVESPTSEEADLINTLEDLSTEGVQHVKIILENSAQVREQASFEMLARRLLPAWSGAFKTLRLTNTRMKECSLTRKGFPSIDLGLGDVYACCVQVGDRPSNDTYVGKLPTSPSDAAQLLHTLISKSSAIEGGVLPCNAGKVFCPLALTG